jgi:hypothetical protein
MVLLHSGDSHFQRLAQKADPSAACGGDAGIFSARRSVEGSLQKIVEAGRAQEATGLDILVTPSVFVELQRTFSAPKDAVVLFRVSDAQRARYPLLVNYFGY